EPQAGITAGTDTAEAMHQRDRPGPRSRVDGCAETELRHIERRRLKRERHIDFGVALVDRETDVHMGHDLRAEAGNTARGAALVADKVALAVGPHRKSIKLAPGAVARPLRGLRGAAARRIIAQAAVEAARRPVAKPLEEAGAEIEQLIARRDLGIDHGRNRYRRRRRGWGWRRRGRWRWRWRRRDLRMGRGGDHGQRKCAGEHDRLQQAAAGCSSLRLRRAAHDAHFQTKKRRDPTSRFAPVSVEGSIGARDWEEPVGRHGASDATAGTGFWRFPERGQKLANSGVSCCNLRNRIGRSTVRFSTIRKIEQTRGPFVARHALKARLRLFYVYVCA